MRLRRAIAVVAAVAGVALTAGAGPAAAVTPGTILDETLTASTSNLSGPYCGNGQCIQTSGACNPAGNTTIDFTTSGVAVGPYPGTFTASGSVTVGPQTMPNTALSPVAGTIIGPNLSLTETFTIHSGATTITGTKQLAPNVISFVPGTGGGSCTTEPGGFTYGDEASATYTATIKDPTGSVTQTGNTELNFNEAQTSPCGSLPGGACTQGQFAEAFYTANQLPGCDQNAQGGQNQGGNSQGCKNP